jgi:hypothetical protein
VNYNIYTGYNNWNGNRNRRFRRWWDGDWLRRDF